uniref:ABC transmembrane type-1 domain-containing protein n=1 Tax=Salix viminalis TaxID=40686 RepID=A0A6N2LIZ8_SALVM
MSSLQLLQLTERGRGLLANRRKSLLLAAGILAAGGTAAYVQSRISSKKSDSFLHSNGLKDDKKISNKLVTNDKKTTQKKGGLKSLKFLAAVLLSHMGKMGAKDLLAMIAIAVLKTTLSNRLAKVQGFLFRAAFLRRVPLFFRLISENILLCFLISTMHSTSKYVTGTLSLCFRKILTKLIHAHYFENMAYYKISHVDGRITNPEQRIASDVPRFCSELSELVLDDLTAVTDGVLYTWRLCSYTSPKYLFWMVAYILGAGTLIKNFSPAFGKLMSKEQQLEGEYRQLHSRLRTHAESIAFYGGERREEFHIQQKFKTLIRHMSTVLHDHWWFGMIQDFLFKYLGATVAVILIIEPFFSGQLRPDSSTLGRAEMLSNLRYHTSVIISLFPVLGTLSTSSRRLNRLSGYADRIHELISISRVLSNDDKSSLQRSGSKNYFSEADYVEFSCVKVVTPSGNVLVQDLTLKVDSGSNLLITGPNGSGKSSLFRVLGGLWPLVSGHIVKPGVGSDLNKEIFYVPQRPYTAVDLEYLLDRYPPTKEVNWGEELSLGSNKGRIHQPDEAESDITEAFETDRKNDAMVVQKAFSTSDKVEHSYISEVIAASPSVNHNLPLPIVPPQSRAPRVLPLRVAAMFKILVPSILDKQGAHLLAVAFLVVSRTFVSDRIASLNGTTVKFCFEQDRASFVRLIGVSVLQSAASSFIAPSLRREEISLGWFSKNLCFVSSSKFMQKFRFDVIELDKVYSPKACIQKHLKPAALGWRIRLTQHLLKNYLRNNTFYKVFNMSSKNIDADQRITHDLEKLTTDLSGLVTGMVKPSVDILWFTWRMKLLTGQRGVAILYTYMLLGLGFLRAVTPDFGDLASRKSSTEETFRFMHERLRTHAESVAFFGGGKTRKDMIESRFRELLDHSMLLLKKKWSYGILDDFVTKQLPNNVTWGLSLLYAVENNGDRAMSSTQGELAHALRYLASVVSQSFFAFGDILELHKKFAELSGSINRIFELEELLDSAQSGDSLNCKLSPSKNSELYSEDATFLVECTRPDIHVKTIKSNGSGKSSVFRVLRGLWPIASGRLAKPSQHINKETGSGCGIFYVLNDIYMLGNLSRSIIYPLSRDEAEVMALKLSKKGTQSAEITNILDTCLKNILENVRLNYLLEREGGWDANSNWEDTLSLGEQQRLGMARLFFHKPTFAILDECTNATSVDVEEQLYRLANDMGITFVTSSQRPALIPFHSLELRLIDGEGQWELRSIKR